MQIYVIRDVKAEAILQMGPNGLHLFRNDVVAIRFLEDLVNDPQTMLNKHPEDFELWQAGAVDEEGRITSTQSRLVLQAVEAIRQAAAV